MQKYTMTKITPNVRDKAKRAAKVLDEFLQDFIDETVERESDKVLKREDK